MSEVEGRRPCTSKAEGRRPCTSEAEGRRPCTSEAEGRRPCTSEAEGCSSSADDAPSRDSATSESGSSSGGYLTIPYGGELSPSRAGDTPRARAAGRPPLREKVYALELEGGKIYVGRSANVARRIDAHAEGRGSRWTQEHPVVRRVDLLSLPGGDPRGREIVETFYWARHRGVENVRGAYWCRLNPSPAEIKWMRQQVYGFFDLCYICGGGGHFARRCPARPTCGRCGRRSHETAQCYASPRPLDTSNTFDTSDVTVTFDPSDAIDTSDDPPEPLGFLEACWGSLYRLMFGDD